MEGEVVSLIRNGWDWCHEKVSRLSFDWTKAKSVVSFSPIAECYDGAALSSGTMGMRKMASLSRYYGGGDDVVESTH
jgi:hypothetical protein